MKFLLPLLLLVPCHLLLAGDSRPNVLFILADDLGRQDLTIEGSKYYETPHIDSIAKSGMRFEYGYSACQVCSPSRASIMTGKVPARHGVTDWIGAKTGTAWNRNDRVLPPGYTHHLVHEDTTLAEAFKAGGYTTFFAGKWHIGGKGSFPEDHGFDINIGGHHAGSPPGGFFAPYTNPKMKSGPDGESLPIRLAAETSKFIESNAFGPFFAFLSFYSVHGPIQTTPDLWKKYRDKAAAAGPAPEERFLIDRTLPVRQVQDCPIYAGMMQSMDTAVGNVLTTLKKLDLAKNTIVVFTSDNGGVTSGDAFSTAALPFRGGKGRQWEGGLRAPYYISAPGVTKPGTTSETPVNGTDFFPTLLELAGLASLPGQHVDGISLLPVLKNSGAVRSRKLFWHYPHYGNQGGEPSAVALDLPWKLIHYYEDGRDELYNITADPGEQTDLTKQHPDRAAALRKALDAHLTETGARIPKPDPRFDPAKKAKQLESIATTRKPRLEKQHANFLSPTFQPNPTWWGSKVTED